MANGIASGDTVRLKSGSPLMTVLDVSDIGGTMMATCAWFDQHLKEGRATYNVVALDKEES